MDIVAQLQIRDELTMFRESGKMEITTKAGQNRDRSVTLTPAPRISPQLATKFGQVVL